MPEQDPFGAFDEKWAETPEAARMNFGRVPPGTYKFVCAAVRMPKPGDEENEELQDREIIDNREKGGSIGLKLFFEILEPESVMNEKTGEPEPTKGRIVEHVFWITEKNLPYVKRDVKTIIGREIVKASELTRIPWAGQTFEAGVGDEEYNGYMHSRVKWFNAWRPQGAAGGSAPSTPAPTPGSGGPKAPAAASAGPGNGDAKKAPAKGKAAAAPKEKGELTF